MEPVDGIIIIDFRNRVLDAFERLLLDELQSVCMKLHRAAGLTDGNVQNELYEYKNLKDRGLLFLRSAEPAGGFDRRVSIVFGEHRQEADEAWEGDMCNKNNILIALSRASERCHVIIEDLRRWITVPRGGPLRKECQMLLPRHHPGLWHAAKRGISLAKTNAVARCLGFACVWKPKPGGPDNCVSCLGTAASSPRMTGATVPRLLPLRSGTPWYRLLDWSPWLTHCQSGLAQRRSFSSAHGIARSR